MVIGWDGSEHAHDALEFARTLAATMDADLVAATVAVDRLGAWRGTAHEDALRRHAEEQLARLPGAGRQVAATRVVLSPSAAHGLHDLAEELGARAIVIGPTHHGRVGRVFTGTVAGDLLNGAPCPVGVAPRGYAGRYAARLMRIVAVAYDSSREAALAVEVAAGIARSARAQLRVVAVLEPLPVGATAGVAFGPPDLYAIEQEKLRDDVDRVVGSLDDLEVDGRVVGGTAAAALADEAEEGVDLLVTGSRGYGPLGRTLLGSVSSELVRSAPCPVLVVPRPAEPADAS